MFVFWKPILSDRIVALLINSFYEVKIYLFIHRIKLIFIHTTPNGDNLAERIALEGGSPPTTLRVTNFISVSTTAGFGPIN